MSTKTNKITESVNTYNYTTFEEIKITVDDFYGFTFIHCDFNECVFENVNFKIANIINCDFNFCEFKNCKFDYSAFTRTNFHQSGFSNCEIHDTSFKYCNMSICRFIDTDLRASSIYSSSISNTSFNNVYFTDVILNKLMLVIVTLRNTDLSECKAINYTTINTQHSIDLGLYQVNNVGIHRRIITYFAHKDLVFAGCFKGSLTDLLSSVKCKYEDPKDFKFLQTYTTAIDYFKATANISE